MSRTAVFAGVSIAADEVSRLLPGVEVHPPARDGDVRALGLGPGDRLGIVDVAVFEAVPLKRKELIEAMASGVAVAGAGAGGALRAVELEHLGMRGCGRVFRAFRSGALCRDDEVVHPGGLDGYGAGDGDALVNLRHTLRAARRSGLLDAGEARAAEAAAAALPLPRRSLWRALEEAGLDEGRRAAVEAWAAAGGRADVLHDDAVALLRLLGRGGLEAMVWEAPPPVTSWMRHARFRRAATLVPGGDVTDAELLSFAQAIAVDYPALHRRALLERIATLGGAANAGSWDDEALEEQACRLGREWGWWGEALDERHVQGWLSEDERATLSPTAQAARVAVRAWRIHPGIADREPLVEALRRTGAAPRLADAVRACHAFNDDVRSRNPAHTVSRLAGRAISAWFDARWQEEGGDPELRLLERGFLGRDDLLVRARPYLLLDRSGDALRDIRLGA